MHTHRAALTALIALLLVAWQTDVPSSQPAGGDELRVLVGPDHLFEEVRSVIDGAAGNIDLVVHALDHAGLVEAIVARQLGGVRVRVLLERGLTGDLSDQERWAAGQIEQAGGAVYLRYPSEAVADRAALQRARFIIVDDASALVGSGDLTNQAMPADDKADGTAGQRGIYLLARDPAIVEQLSAIFAEALEPSPSHRLVRWTGSQRTQGVSALPARAAEQDSYRVVRHAPLLIEGPAAIGLAGCPDRCLAERDALLTLVDRAGPGDTVLVEQLHEDPSAPRLNAYIAAARRGAAVRILLDRPDEGPGGPRGNGAAAGYVNAVARAERLDLEARLGTPTNGSLHNGMVLASLRGTQYVHVGSPGGSEPSASGAIAVQLQSADAYFYLEEIFTSDWMAGDLRRRVSGAAEPGTESDARPPVHAFSAPVLAQASAQAAAPPPGSALARGDHPRVFVTRDELPSLRDRLAHHYAGELQEFLDVVAGPSLTRQQRDVEVPWGALNYAFVALLDPQELRRRGFRLAEAIDTAVELCGRSWTYTQRLLPEIAAGEGQSHSAIQTDFSNPLHLPVIAAYDWCAPHWADAERRLVVDAFVSSWDKNWRGEDPLTAHGKNGMVANNTASADLHDTLGILAFYGDGYPDRATQAALYETFHRVWLDRVLVELQYFYGPGTGWHEGSGGYLKEGHLNLGLPFALISSALGKNYFVDVPFFAQYPLFLAANIKPHGQLSPDGRRYLERWGVISGGISGIGCRGVQLTGGMLARAGDPRAGVARWLHLGEYESRPCAEEMRRRGELWVNAALYWFLFGDRQVDATPPQAAAVPTSLRLGLGEYVFRSDWSPAATQLVAWTTPWELYGHEPRTDGGHFTLHKFGNLIVHAGNGKSGEADLDGFVDTNLALNVVGIRRGAEPVLQFAPVKTLDPFWGQRGIDRIELRGELIADQIGGPLDYVAFDATLAWTERGDAVDREIVYLRGPTNGEYVVVLDRIALRNDADVPIWKVWTAAESDFWAGVRTPQHDRAGLWEATGRPVARVVNQRSGLTTRYFESPDTHGTLFVTPVWPSRARMRILGGAGREFQDLDGGTPFGTPPMTDGSREYLGWGRIETWPLDRASHHVFLHVLQPGDAGTLRAPAAATPLASADGAWIGAVVEHPGNPWVLMWMKNRDRSPVLPLRYREPAGGRARHVIFNLRPNQLVRVERTGGDVIVGGASGSEATSSPAGVLVIEPEP
jgi:hypothetical protein